MKAISKKMASVILAIAVMLSVVVPFSVTTVSAADAVTAESYINYAQLPYEEGMYKSPYDDEAEAKRLEILNSPNVLTDQSGGTDVGMLNNLKDTRMVYCTNAEANKTFAQYLGIKQNGVEIKPNTTYVMSFDVYSTGGNYTYNKFKLSYGMKSLYTGHNETYPNANIWMKSSGTVSFSKGYNHASIEFTTIDNQTDFIYAIESKDTGKGYLWNFKLYEKGKSENLLTYSSLVFKSIDDMHSDVLGGYGWHITKNSVYSLVDYVNEYGALEGSANGTTTNKTLTYITYKDPDIPPRSFYISNNGSDDNSGTSPDKPWKSLSKLEGVKGLVYSPVTVFLERGSTFRGSIKLYSYMNFAAYGEGEKPKIYGSAQNYANATWTKNATYSNVWELNMGENSVDVGSIVFNHGEKVGFRIFSTTKTDTTVTHDSLDAHFEKMFQDRYNKDLTFIYYNKKVYLRSDKGNPATLFDSIEITDKGFGGSGTIMYNPTGVLLQDVTIENICLKYANFGITTGSGGSKNVTMRNLEIGYIGGCLQNETTRYGNGIEVWANSTYVTIEDCWVYQCYDAGITNQCSTNTGAPNVYNWFDHITFDGNLIEFCQYNIEFFNSANKGSYCHNMNYTNNILRFAGYQVFDPKERLGSNSSYTALINSNKTAHDFGGSYVIEGNIFDTSYGYIIKSGEFNTDTGAMVRGNTYLQQPKLPTYFFGMGTDKYPIVPTISGAGIKDWKHIGNQFVMEELVAAIDTDPKTVTFMSNADTGNYLIKCDETTKAGATYALTDAISNGTANFNLDCYFDGNDGDAVIINLATGATVYTLNGGKNVCDFTAIYSGTTKYAIKYLTVPTRSKIYLDNVKITVGSQNVFNPYTKQQTGAPICVTVFEEDMAYDTDILNKNLNIIKFKNSSAATNMSLTDSKSSSSKSVSVTFKYKLTGTVANEEIYVYNSKSANTLHPDAVTGSRYLQEGEHTYTYTATKYSASNFRLALRSASTSNATLSIWDLEVMVAGKVIELSPEISSTYQSQISFTSGKYSDIINSEKAYLIDFNNATRKCISSEKALNSDGVIDENIIISFDYYLAGAEDEEIALINVAGGAFADKDINSYKLYKGRNHITYTNEHYTERQVFLLDLRADDKDTTDDVAATTNAKIYIWNVVVQVNGENVFTTAKNNTYDDGNVTVTEMTVGDVPFRGDSNNDGKVNVLDLIRLKRHLLGEMYVKESQANAYWDHRIDALDIAATKKAILGIKL